MAVSLAILRGSWYEWLPAIVTKALLQSDSHENYCGEDLYVFSRYIPSIMDVRSVHSQHCHSVEYSTAIMKLGKMLRSILIQKE
jgi:hypothetical protein